MASTLFTDASGSTPGTVVQASWLNDANTTTYPVLSAVAGTNTITGVGPTSMQGAYASGRAFRFIPQNTNTGATTLNISSIGAKAVTKYGTTALVAGDIVAGYWAYVIYDGTQFQLINPRNTDLGTTTGLLDVSTKATGALPIANGGTGASTAAVARTNLNVAQIGPTFSATLTANQAMTNSTTTVILWDTKDFDTTTAYTVATGRFNPQVAGYYQITWGCRVDGNGNSVSSAVAILYKNGSEYVRGSSFDSSTALTLGSIGSTGSAIVFMNGSTDFLDIRGFCTVSAGSPRILSAVSNRFSGVFLHP